jgi:hypothetical protein
MQQQKQQQQQQPVSGSALFTGMANMAIANSMPDLHTAEHDSVVVGCMDAGSLHCSQVGARWIAMVPFWLLPSL